MVSTSDEAAISLDNVTKRYGDIVALSELSFSVRRGEIFGFLGPNGAGKTTVINLLLNFIRPTTGTVRVLGHDAQRESPQIRSQTGILPEHSGVYDQLTGYEHVEFAVESKNVDDDPSKILERVGLVEAADRKAGSYSKGMTQRLLLGMALVGSPDLLILDEPTSALDPRGARMVREIVTEENNRGATVFFSSHILSQVEAVCDHVGILRDGSLVVDDTLDRLREETADTTLTVNVDSIPDGALESVRQLSGVSTLAADGTTLTVSCADTAETAVLNTLEEAGASLESFTNENGSLENLFMAYTEENL
ncbi:ABC transporter ATP-binding protein [Halogeometricum borinquense]|uniref:ABC transporter ATP-binding protein n=1 Tax=Halogeometricum borinquense TaxID=60847 RepID=A0A482T6Z8_9EURY|nr:ABC transporter ATP-binding protein [Halogeometricum borinquense]RYJ08375.1 ABC transporter ATP-binding protein [Halogeometricum borinquense]